MEKLHEIVSLLMLMVAGGIGGYLIREWQVRDAYCRMVARSEEREQELNRIIKEGELRLKKYEKFDAYIKSLGTISLN